jgi:elongation factor 1 alpha-like protein
VLIVDAAGKKTDAPASSKKKAAGADTVAHDVKALKIDDTPLPKSKNLNVLTEFENSKSKKTASFVVVGESNIPTCVKTRLLLT